MRTHYQEFEPGDKVRLLTDWYERHGFVFKKGDIFTVKSRGNSKYVQTDKGGFLADELELVEEE